MASRLVTHLVERRVVPRKVFTDSLGSPPILMACALVASQR